MFGIDYPSAPLPSLSWKKPTVIIVGTGILSFAIWTLPTWQEFWSHVAQFPSLWQIPANRTIILFLSMKMIAPLLVMGITTILICLYFFLKLPQDEPEPLVPPQKEPHRPAAQFQPTSSLQHRHSQAFSVRSRHLSSASPDQPEPLQLSAPSFSQTPTGHRQPHSVSEELPGTAADAHEALQQTERQRVNVASVPAPHAAPPQVFTPEESTVSRPLISLRLLKDISVTINVPGGGRVVVPLTPNAKRVQLLAYIAWRRGELIDRDKILEQVFGWGLSDEEATEEKLSERFESHKKLLRKKIREIAVEQVNKPAGKQIIEPDIDPFVSDSGFWGLADICRVEDLEIVEQASKIIMQARKEGKLIDTVPEAVKEACERVIANYPGDFLESLIKKYPGEFRSWQGRSSWARKPYTHYRDGYLDALWYAAEYDWRMGQRSIDDPNREGDEAKQRTQQEYFGRAAQHYQTYAMYACNSKFDMKVTFGAHGELGERIGMSERALRRCVMLLGALGRTDLVNQVWSAYATQMKSISDGRWQPGQETLADVEAAKAQTGEYRFTSQITKRHI